MAEIKGQVRIANGLVAGGLAFELFRERFGAEPELLTPVLTADDGTFTVPDVELGDRATLVAKIRTEGQPDIELTPLRPAQEPSAMNFVVPAAGASFASEFQRLTDAVTPVLGGVSLAAAQESATRRDLSLVHRQSGWDARLVAIAAMSSRLTQDVEAQPATGLDEQTVYGMLRAGLPSNRTLLARVPPATVRAALAKSASAGVIDLNDAGRDGAVAAFETFAKQERLATRPAGGVSTVAELLAATGLSTEGDDDSPRTKFERAVLDTASTDSVWTRAANEGIDDGTIRALKTQAKLAFLTTNNAPLMARVAVDVPDAAGLDEALVANRWDDESTWATAIDQLGGADAVPAVYRTEDDPVRVYASELARRVRVAYPTHVVAAMVQRDELAVGADAGVNAMVATALQRAGDLGFRLGSTHAQSFVADNAGILDGIGVADQRTVANAMATLQRTYQLSPSNQSMKVLLDQGMTSAYDIVALSEASFIDRYGRLFPSEREARLVHRKAEQVSAVLYNFYSMTKQAASTPALTVVSGTAERHEEAVANIMRVLPATPTMESLFGSMDYCECDHCRSVLGPAAYLVDLLKFLDPDPLAWEGFRADWAKRHNGEPYPNGTPYDELMTRRPDLAHLGLSCENTNTELPVIDIVNEILEFLVAHPALTPEAAHDSGAVQSADVMSEPEFTLDVAYERLRTATYPSVLPFDVWHETVRGFTGWMDEPLADLLDVFHATDADDGGRYGAAVERLGLTRAEADVLTAVDPLTGWWTRFGFAADADQEAVAVTTLQKAKQLARRLGVNYQELADLLGTNLVNPSLDQLGVLTTAGVSVADAIVWRANQAMIAADEPAADPDRTTWLTVRSVQDRLATVTRSYALEGTRTADAWLRALPDAAFAGVVVLVDPDASCDFDRTLLGSAATGTPLDGARLAEVVLKLDVFVRLQRAIGWSIADLDQALVAFVPGGTAGTAMFGAPVRTALVHLSRAIELAGVLGVDEDDRRRLVAFWTDLTTHGPRPLYNELFLGRPVGQRDPSFAAPLGDVLSPDAVGPDDLGLARSHVSALQGALGLRARDLQDIADRLGPIWSAFPLTLATISDLHRYAYLAEVLGWTVGDVLKLERLSGIDPFAALAAEPLAVVDASHRPHATLAFARLAKQVEASGFTPSDLEYLLAHRVDPTYDQGPDPDATKALLDGVSAKVAEALARLAAVPPVVVPPVGAPPVGAPEGDVPKVPAPPTPEEVVAAIMAAALGPRGGLVGALLNGPDALPDPSTPAEPRPSLVQVFVAMTEPGADPQRAERAHLLLTKVLLLADGLDLTAHECSVFGLGSLPLAEVEVPPPAFPTLVELLDHRELREATAAGHDSIADVVVAARGAPAEPADARLGAASAALATATRRPVDVVAATVAALGLSADELIEVRGIARVWTVLALIERLGVDAGTVARWLRIADPATPLADRQDIARNVRDAVRSHLGPVRWRQVAKPVSDRLRQRQRDALVATVLHDQNLTSLEELYQVLLIDPGSEPVLRTSRIRQAISSCQLFVQRCLLNIEPRVHPSALNAEHWEWMKRYRVWEANRKIFLYPENWLEPEFRDDKTHLFDELESTLLQSDVSADVVEDAFLVYLRKLDEIARLDVVGFYTEQDALDPGSTTLHVIGRTHGGPHQYFYRRLQDGMWTPWEPMGVDIEGDHIVPVVWRNRLYVFWVTFLQKSDDGHSNPTSTGSVEFKSPAGLKWGGGDFQISAGGASAAKPPPKLAEASVADARQGAGKDGVGRRIDVQLNWSEYLRGSWSPSMSGGFGRVPPQFTNSVFDPTSVFVHASTLWDDGEEAGVQIHLSGAMARTFLLRGRNSVPEPGTPSAPPSVPYNTPRPAINRYQGGGALTVTFAQKLTSVNGGAETSTSSKLGILGSGGAYSVLPSANGIAIGAGDIGSLVSPFFFQDERRTFFVEPSLLETTTESWEEWIVPDPDPGTTFDPGDIEIQVVVPFVPPERLVPVGPDDTDPLLDPWNDLFTQLPHDLITSPQVAVLFDDTVLGSRGGVDLTVVSARAGVDRTVNVLGAQDLAGQAFIPVVAGNVDDSLSTTAVTGDTGTQLVADHVVLVDHSALIDAGLSTSTDHITIIGTNGFTNAHVGLRSVRGFGR